MAVQGQDVNLDFSDNEDDMDFVKASIENDPIRVVYATDGCVITHSLMLMAGQVNLGDIYIVSYYESGRSILEHGSNGANETCQDFAAPPEGISSILVDFCLPCPNRVCGNARKDRVRPMFVCRFTTERGLCSIYAALMHGKPLSSEIVAEALIEDATYALHHALNVTLYVAFGGATSRRGRSADSAEPLTTNSVKALTSTYPGGQRGFAALYIQHEQRVLAAYRRAFGGVVTPFWYVSKFGPDEKTLVLGTRYYLLQAHECGERGSDYDLQAIRDLCGTYNVNVGTNPTGLVPSDLTSFALLSKFCCSSNYARGRIASMLATYIERRIAADMAEVGALREFLVNDRGCLRISDKDFVTYVYLAHFECFNREQLTNHLNAVTVREPEETEMNIIGKSGMGERAVESFFSHVRAQLNIDDYIKQNVVPKVLVLTPDLAKMYVNSKTYHKDTFKQTHGNTVVGIWDYATQIARRLDKVEAALVRRGWPESNPSAPSLHQTGNRQNDPSDNSYNRDNCDELQYEQGDWMPSQFQIGIQGSGYGIVKRLLTIAATEPPAGTMAPACLFIGSKTSNIPLPSYRIGMPNGKQAFGIITGDVWSRITGKNDTFEPVIQTSLGMREQLSLSDLAAVDMKITSIVTSSFENQRSIFIASSIVGEQMYANRNEIFNGSLAIGNIILDVDMHLKQAVPLIALHTAMRGFRKGALTALSLIMPKTDVDWSSYPCYFYKSACTNDGRVKTSKNVDNQHSSGLETDEHYEMLEDPSLYHDASHILDEPFDSYDSGFEGYNDETALFEMLDSAPNEECSEQEEEIDIKSELTNRLDTVASNVTCDCVKKIGMRISIPVPTPYLLFGSKTMVGIARLIQQAVLLDRSFAEAISIYAKDYNFIDTGIYGNGRSLRLPFLGKVTTENNIVGRLLPFIVVPESCNDVNSFISGHFEPRNFHFHSLPIVNEMPHHVIYSLGGDYISFFDAKTNHNRDRFFAPRTSLVEALGVLGVCATDSTAVEEFATCFILEELIRYLENHFVGYAHEYKNAIARCRILKADWLLLQLIPSRSSHLNGFSCVRYKHTRTTKGSARTFLAISVDAHGRLCASLSQQCFATKCGSNKLNTLFTVDIGGAINSKTRQ